MSHASEGELMAPDDEKYMPKQHVEEKISHLREVVELRLDPLQKDVTKIKDDVRGIKEDLRGNGDDGIIHEIKDIKAERSKIKWVLAIIATAMLVEFGRRLYTEFFMP
jgi:hypothetical protein